LISLSSILHKLFVVISFFLLKKNKNMIFLIGFNLNYYLDYYYTIRSIFTKFDLQTIYLYPVKKKKLKPFFVLFYSLFFSLSLSLIISINY